MPKLSDDQDDNVDDPDEGTICSGQNTLEIKMKISVVILHEAAFIEEKRQKSNLRL